MSEAIENLLKAQHYAITIRPKIHGFPYLAEALRKARVYQNIWHLPSCQSIYLTKLGPVVTQRIPLITSPADIPLFDQKALIKAIKIDQKGESSFSEFLTSAWQAGVIKYFEIRNIIYYGGLDESYLEHYPKVIIK